MERGICIKFWSDSEKQLFGLEGKVASGGSANVLRAPGPFSATVTGDVGTTVEVAEVKVQ